MTTSEERHEHSDVRAYQHDDIHISHIRHGELTLLMQARDPSAGALLEMDRLGKWGELDPPVRRALFDWLTHPDVGVALYNGRHDLGLYGEPIEAPFRAADGTPREVYPVEQQENTVNLLYTINLDGWEPNPFADDVLRPDSVTSVPPVVERLNTTVLRSADGHTLEGTDYTVLKVAPNWLAASGNC
jgi:hypothetical protein